MTPQFTVCGSASNSQHVKVPVKCRCPHVLTQPPRRSARARAPPGHHRRGPRSATLSWRPHPAIPAAAILGSVPACSLAMRLTRSCSSQCIRASLMRIAASIPESYGSDVRRHATEHTASPRARLTDALAMATFARRTYRADCAACRLCRLLCGCHGYSVPWQLTARSLTKLFSTECRRIEDLGAWEACSVSSS